MTVPPGNPANLLPDAPYGDGSTLHPPLTAEQKTTIAAFCAANGYDPSLFGTVIKTDANYIAAYKAVAVGGKGQTKTEWSPPGLGTLKDLLGFLGNPVRLGELVVGVILLGVAFNAALKSGPAKTIRRI
jgi:hypothetical protein